MSNEDLFFIEEDPTLNIKKGWLDSFVFEILKCGDIPKHIAFIMDGNRRFANKSNLNRTDGHKKGFETLGKVLSWCRAIGVKQVTLYAFSIENFKRTPNEVNSIMNLARDKCDHMLDELDKVNDAGVRVRVVGDLDLLPEDLRARIEKIHTMTSNNTNAFLNICMAYTSRHELVTSLKNISALVKEQKLSSSNVNLSIIENELYLPRPYPDLIIRTSGEVRLSDFMLWQCQKSILLFVDALWPEITVWDFFKAIFHYQYNKKFSTEFNTPL